MKILVTGGCGFVGSNLASGFARAGHEVVAMDNLMRRGSEFKLKTLRDFGVEFIYGDVRSAEDLERVGKCDLLLECSAEPSVHSGYGESPAYLIGTNLGGMLNCLEFARKRASSFIFLSSSRVYPIAPLRGLPLKEGETRLDLAPEYLAQGCSYAGVAESFPLPGGRSLYGATKLAAEVMLEEYGAMYGMPYAINRCGVIAGPGQMGRVDQGFASLWLARHYWRGTLDYQGFGGRGLQVRDILHIDDLLDLVLLQASDLKKYGGGPWNAGGGREASVSLLELTRICEEVTAK